MKTKFTRIGVSGNTVDGREVTEQEINQMAESYNPETYGARIWLEHLRGLSPDSTFKAYGDVLELEARDVTINGKERRGLYAVLDANDELVEINKSGQKIYTSMEIHTDFEKTKTAYLYGLGVTDSPASLGTEPLKLYSTRNKNDKTDYAEFQELELEFVEDEDKALFSINALTDAVKSLTNKIKNNNAKELSAEDLQAFSTSLTEFNTTLENLSDALKSSGEISVDKFNAMQTKLDALETKIQTFQQLLDDTPAGGDERPPADGGNGEVRTNC